MCKFFKEYFIFSYKKEGYLVPKVRGVTKISQRERIIWLIISYAIIIFSLFVIILPLSWYQKLFLFFILNFFPIFEIFNLDFRIFKIMKLFFYSRSKNMNKRIIYIGYMIDDYRNIFLNVFNEYRKKKINIDNKSSMYSIKCFFKNVRLSIVVRPSKIVVIINDKKNTIKGNKDSFEILLRKIKEKMNI